MALVFLKVRVPVISLLRLRQFVLIMPGRRKPATYHVLKSDAMEI